MFPFISKIFLVPKPDGRNRFISNRKELNEFLQPVHFKLEDARTCMKLIQKDSFMATIDLKDAYYLISIVISYRKYQRFLFESKVYEFVCLPLGFSTAPYIFTEVLKPVIAYLRNLGYPSVVYLDDILLTGNTYEECLHNVSETCSLLKKLGFIINEKKS